MNTIIFDFDGTLADTLPVIHEAFQTVFWRYQKRQISKEEIHAMFGPAETDILKKHLAEDAAAAIEDYHQHYEENHTRLVQRSEEIESLLQYLQSKSVYVAVVTGKGRRSLDASLKALGMAEYFNITVAGDEVARSKPDPDGIQRVIKVAGTTPDQTMFIGDSNADIKAGKSAGVETIGVQWLEHFQAQNFEEEPDKIFKEVRDFQKYLEGKI